MVINFSQNMSQSTAKEKWQITPEAFDILLLCLDSNRETAAEKYLKLRKNIVRFFEGRGFYAAEDHADEVFNRVARKLNEGEKIENVGQYVYGISRFLVLELHKERVKEDKFLNQQPVSSFPQAEMDEQDEKEKGLRCLNRCLTELPEDSRELVIQYFQGEKREKIERRQKMAEELGIPQNALRSRVTRLRDKLEECISGCLKKK